MSLAHFNRAAYQLWLPRLLDTDGCRTNMTADGLTDHLISKCATLEAKESIEPLMAVSGEGQIIDLLWSDNQVNPAEEKLLQESCDWYRDGQPIPLHSTQWREARRRAMITTKTLARLRRGA